MMTDHNEEIALVKRPLRAIGCLVFDRFQRQVMECPNARLARALAALTNAGGFILDTEQEDLP